MLGYILRRIFYAIPILIGVNFLTFALFFIVNTPDDMARMHLGQKHVSPAAVERWKETHGYDKPLFLNAKASGAEKITNTLFYTKSIELFRFKFGVSDRGRDIGHDISERMWPSIAIAIPTLLLGLFLNICFFSASANLENFLMDSCGYFFR